MPRYSALHLVEVPGRLEVAVVAIRIGPTSVIRVSCCFCPVPLFSRGTDPWFVALELRDLRCWSSPRSVSRRPARFNSWELPHVILLSLLLLWLHRGPYGCPHCLPMLTVITPLSIITPLLPVIFPRLLIPIQGDGTFRNRLFNPFHGHGAAHRGVPNPTIFIPDAIELLPLARSVLLQDIFAWIDV